MGLFRYVAIDGPLHFANRTDLWELAGRALSFRDQQLSQDWPGQHWLEGADLHACHLMVLKEEQIVGVIRLARLHDYELYGTRSPTQKIIESQSDPALREHFQSLFRSRILSSQAQWLEWSQFVLAREYQHSRLGVQSRLRERLLAFSIFTARWLGFNKLFLQTRDEINSAKFVQPMGFRFLDEGERALRFKTGTSTRLMYCDGIDTEYLNWLEATYADEFTAQSTLYTSVATTPRRSAKSRLQEGSIESEL